MIVEMKVQKKHNKLVMRKLLFLNKKKDIKMTIFLSEEKKIREKLGNHF